MIISALRSAVHGSLSFDAGIDGFIEPVEYVDGISYGYRVSRFARTTKVARLPDDDYHDEN